MNGCTCTCVCMCVCVCVCVCACVRARATQSVFVVLNIMCSEVTDKRFEYKGYSLISTHTHQG